MNDEAARSAADAIRFIAAEFTLNRRLAERAVAQMPPAELGWLPDEHSNSVAMLMKHVGGNLHSRFTDFLTTDGEKPGRDRDAEFRNDVVDHDTVLALWTTGWESVEATLRHAQPGRAEPRDHDPRRAAHRAAGVAACDGPRRLPLRSDRGTGTHAQHALEHPDPAQNQPALTPTHTQRRHYTATARTRRRT